MEKGRKGRRKGGRKEIKGRENPVQFSHSVVSDSLQPHGLQHTTKYRGRILAV